MISVIVPVFNVKRYLERCITSIINQSYKELEIILIDDGSTDESAVICNNFSRKDNRIIVVHQKNAGLPAARNAGIELATGEYIIFVDADDYIHPDMIKKLYDLVSNSAAKIGMCNVCRVSEADNRCFRNNNEVQKKRITKRQAMLGLYRSWKYIVAWNKIYDRTIFDNLRYKEGIINEDTDIAVKLYNNTEYVMITNEILYYYRQRSDSIIGSDCHVNNMHIFDVYRERASYFENIKDIFLLKCNVQEAIYRCYDFYWLNKKKTEKRTLDRMRKDLMFYLTRYGRLINLKKRICILIFAISPFMMSVLKSIKNMREHKK